MIIRISPSFYLFLFSLRFAGAQRQEKATSTSLVSTPLVSLTR